MSTKSDALYAEVAEDLIARMEAGTGTWSMPWTSLGGHHSVVGRAYRGVNTLILDLTASRRGYESLRWGTFKAWKEAGASIRKGEKASQVILWKPTTRKDKETGEEVSSMYVTTYNVFNAEQVEGWTEPEVEPGPDPIEAAEAFFKAVPSVVTHRANGAHYTPAADKINVPKIGLFKSAEAYYSTMAHEHVHWTGHESRLDRNLSTRFGSDAYAMEELIAELGAAFWGAAHGITSADRSEDHASYLASWVKCLRENPKVIQTVTSKAQAAVDHLEGYQAKEALDTVEQPTLV